MNRLATPSLAIMLMLWATPAVAQQMIKVPAGQNTLLEAIGQVSPGDTLVLVTDGGEYLNDDELRLEIPLTIMAAPGLTNRPVLKNNGDDSTKDIIRMYEDLVLIGLEFDGLAGTDKNAKYAIRTGSSSGDAANVKQDYVLKIMDCYFHDIVSGSDGNAFRAYSATMADSIIVRNTLIENTGKEALRVRDEDNDRPGFGFFNVKYFEVSNSTFWNIKNDAVSVYGGDEDPGTPGPEVVIDHVTIYNAGHYLLNLKDVENARVTNTILVQNYDLAQATGKTLGAPWLVSGARIAYSDTLDISDDGTWTGNRGDPTVVNLYAVDPMFADPDNGDFTLPSDSPLIGAGEDGSTLGDMRWWPTTTSGGTVHQVAAGQNTLLDAVNAAAPGDVIELTSSGGEYLNDNNINVIAPLTVRAAADLDRKPIIKNNEEDESTRVVFDIFDDFTLSGVEIDGQAGTDFNAKYLLRIRNGSSMDVVEGMNLKVIDSYLHDVVAGSDGNFLRQYSETFADTVIFRNVMLNNSGKEGIRIKDESSDRSGMGFYNVGFFEVSNATISNTKADAIYVYGGDEDLNTPEPTFRVDHLTCHNCGFDNGRSVWPRDIFHAEITNSIIAHSAEDREFTIQLEGNSRISHSNTFAVSPIVLQGSATMEHMLDIDPEFADADNLDFMLPENSLLLTASDMGGPIGDPRWAMVGSEREDEIIRALPMTLGQNYPNPFRGQTAIPYRIDQPGVATLDVFDILGRRVAQLVSAHHTAGEYTANLSLEGYASGLYVYALRAHGQVQHRMLMVLE